MKIQTKLILTFILAGVLLMLAATKLMQFSFDRGMVDYINQRNVQQYQVLAEEFADYYRDKQSWDDLYHNPRDFHKIIRNFHQQNKNEVFLIQDNMGRKPPPPREHEGFAAEGKFFPPPHRERKNHKPRPPRGIAVSLLNQNQQVIFGPHKDNKKTVLKEIIVDNKLVGYLGIPKIVAPNDALDLLFIKQQQKQFLIIAGLVSLGATIFALLLAQYFVRPIKYLANITDKLANGDYSVKSTLNRKDELGELSVRLNSMAQQLKRAEDSRRRWVADFSHELRTPLAILRGEIEAILDGVRNASKDNIQSLHEEAEHLQKLIEDLYQLSNADAGEMQYEKENTDIKTVIESAIEHHRVRFKEKNIKISFKTELQTATLWADETRLQQLFDNLLNNSYKYTDADGNVVITLGKNSKNYIISVNDSAPAVADDDLPKLFDYLYRTESSRNRQTGGSGLGLAICAKIIDAHNGGVSSQHSSLGGLSITIRLPITG